MTGVLEFIKIGIIGDFESKRLVHKATNEALRYCADHLEIKLELQWQNILFKMVLTVWQIYAIIPKSEYA